MIDHLLVVQEVPGLIPQRPSVKRYLEAERKDYSLMRPFAASDGLETESSVLCGNSGYFRHAICVIYFPYGVYVHPFYHGNQGD